MANLQETLQISDENLKKILHYAILDCDMFSMLSFDEIELQGTVSKVIDYLVGGTDDTRTTVNG